ncbi:MerR family transcriptional regulator [Brachybacterium sp. P6-10-X1]|uniref:MerR family transcriptional regulator n=1 Tax=Brachybacterium sp. P6-10-X1 TaxID=1903186 RepID=UPI000971A55D|nr:MerR family transcriptional regulator [Brachybacterium sp. P6-10-X1]APX31807.1 MerR family transcriptional regulator [Brachybacterium sp. P6-10-X1]
MAWSTSQLADLAGTTVKTLRHYHAVGLLEEPGRATNGYKQYGTPHLVRLLQIKRLRELGMSLADIAKAGESDDSYAEVLRGLDTQLADSISRQQAVRAELGILLALRTGVDVPAGFESVAGSLTPADRAMMMISTALYDEQGIRDLRLITADHQEADEVFNSLAADADGDTVRAVAAKLAPVLRTIHDRYPSTVNAPVAAGNREGESRRALRQAVTDLYNPAQVEVLRQAYRLALQDAERAGPTPG